MKQHLNDQAMWGAKGAADHPVRHWGDVDWEQLEKDPDVLAVNVRDGGVAAFLKGYWTSKYDWAYLR